MYSVVNASVETMSLLATAQCLQLTADHSTLQWEHLQWIPLPELLEARARHRELVRMLQGLLEVSPAPTTSASVGIRSRNLTAGADNIAIGTFIP
jgi:hypothetical protein